MTLYKLAERQKDWHRLEQLMAKRRSTYSSNDAIAFTQLYRSVCTDLSLASAYHVPEETVQYLHELVARAHNHFYGAQKWTFTNLRLLFLQKIPRLMDKNIYFRLASAMFWVPFLICTALAYVDPIFAERVLGPITMAQINEMYSDGFEQRSVFAGGAGTSFYIYNNVSIALQCFASGLLLGMGTIYVLLFNGIYLGSVFGFMLSGPHAHHFGEFVMAHGPLELMGICVSGCAGMRMGFAMLITHGETRIRSLQKSMSEVMPMVLLAATMISSAAFIEGFVSPSELPATFKAGVMVVSAAAITVYLNLPRLGVNRES